MYKYCIDELSSVLVPFLCVFFSFFQDIESLFTLFC